MKALVINISFFDAFFKVHYTRTSRLTYPIPLPTAVAGMFGSFLGFKRKEAYDNFKECTFGAALVSKENFSENRENATYLLYDKREKGVEKIGILHEPEYYIVVGGDDNKIEDFMKKLEEGVLFLPFGGQNDFFVEDWKLVGIKDVIESDEVSNYVPTQYVEDINQNTVLQIFPVMHNFSDCDENFTFILDGSVKVKKDFLDRLRITEVNGKKIALYSLKDFQVLGEWKT